MTANLTVREQFQRDGFYLAPPAIPADLIARVIPRMDAIIAGEYETGVAPHCVHFTPDDPPEKLRKIDQPHLSDHTIREVIAHPELGRWAAEVTGAQRVQVWAVQQLVKPPGGSIAGNVGLHQDKQYWGYWDDPDHVFTAWIAISDVGPDCGPMVFVRGSNRWGYLGKGDFFAADHLAQKQEMGVPQGEEWEEVPAILPPGAVSFHHALTIHGSGPNRSSRPRRSYAVHMRTERAEPARDRVDTYDYYLSRLDDPHESPWIYG